ncbi:endonuclease domain-containing protein [Psychromicrobium xiongbiense]|uniref:endonuclease domain-containing protein n=1 Tax=Psychromicrobium xiongbiense TaxID=3051184 RepID=UPI0025532BFD|nr:hypothetical protein [Psychromicrobium sp. YIM S02556]
MRTARALNPQLHHRSFTVADALNAGETLGRLRGPDLHASSRGIRVPWGTDQEFHQAVSPLLALTPGAAACFGTAARLWNLPLPGRLDTEPRVHLAKINSIASITRFGVVAHRLKLLETELTKLAELPLTTPGRTWLDLCSVLSLEEAVVLGDAIISSHQGPFDEPVPALGTLQDCRDLIAAHPGARGIRLARAAGDLMRVGAASPPETKLRLAALRMGLPEPEHGVAIVDQRGVACAWPDLAWRRYRLGLQYDGVHHLSPEQQERDARRDNATLMAGWLPLRINRVMVHQFGYDGVMVQVAEALRRRGWRP